MFEPPSIISRCITTAAINARSLGGSAEGLQEVLSKLQIDLSPVALAEMKNYRHVNSDFSEGQLSTREAQSALFKSGFGEIDSDLPERNGFGSIHSDLLKRNGFGSIDSDLLKRNGFGSIDSDLLKRNGFGSIDSDLLKRAGINEIGSDLLKRSAYEPINTTSEGEKGFAEIDSDLLKSNTFPAAPRRNAQLTTRFRKWHYAGSCGSRPDINSLHTIYGDML